MAGAKSKRKGIILFAVCITIALVFMSVHMLSSTVQVSQAVGSVFASDRIAISGMAIGAEDVQVSIGAGKEFSFKRNPDQLRLSSDGTFTNL